MDKDQSRSETFQRAVSAALRAIARKDCDNLSVSFGAETPKILGNEAQLPFPSHDLDPNDVSIIRGAADALALRLRYHNEDTHAKAMPKGRIARQIFDMYRTIIKK